MKLMIKRYIFIAILASFCLFAHSQAGYGVYSFLDLPVSSRLAALGGTNVSLRDNDINFSFQNPALLTSDSHNMIGLNIANYLADIQFGSAVYSRTIGCDNYFAVGIQYVDYGSFMGYNEINDSTQGFGAKDYALSLIYARPITEKFSIGATLKPIYSAFESYTSFGIAMDAGINYNDSANLFSAGLVFKNVGKQLKGYYSDEDGQHLEPLPFNIQFGLTKKFLYAPLRISFTMHNLQQWNLNYKSTNQPTETLGSTSSSSNKISFVDMAFRHTIIGLEFIPSKKFYLTAAYNHRRQKEMSMPGFKSGAGFSFGGGIKVSKFQVGFGMTQFQVGNYAYQFSISTMLNEFRM
jgi:hypothetical protein